MEINIQRNQRNLPAKDEKQEGADTGGEKKKQQKLRREIYCSREK